MQEIEVIAKTQDVVSILDMVPEVRDRLLAEYEPHLPRRITIPLIERLIEIVRLTTISLLPEVNAINAIMILVNTNRPFVVGVADGTHEDHVISLPHTFPIEVISAGRVKYDTNNPSNVPIKPLYVRVDNMTFDIAGLDAQSVEKLFSWTVARVHDIIHAVIEASFIYPPRKDYKTDTRGPIVDSDSVYLAKILGDVTARDFMLPKEIFGSNLGILGYGAFRNALTMGKDYDEALNDLKRVIQVQERDAAIAEKNATEEYEKTILIKYIHDRLPHKRAHEILDIPNPRKSHLLARMTDIERDMVLKAIADDDKIIEGMTNNPCPHRKIIGNIYKSANADDKKETLRSLEEYIGETIDDVIVCKKCSYPLMCPHALAHQRALAEMKNVAEIKTILSGYIYPDKVEGNYVCRLCGEIIIGITAFDAVVGDAAIGFMERDDDPEASALWSEVSYLTKYVSFDNLVNRSSFVKSVVNIIWPIVSVINNRISASRGNSAEEIASKKRLNNAVHIFAAFIYFSIASKVPSGNEDVVKVSLTYPADMAGKTEISKMMNYAVLIITDTLSIHIRRAGNLSSQMIANDILNAYKAINETKRGAVTQAVNVSLVNDMWIGNSFMWYISQHLGLNLLDAINRVAPFTEVAEKSKRTIAIRKFVGLAPPPSTAIKMMATTPEELIAKKGNTLLRVYGDYYKASFGVMYDLAVNAYKTFGDVAARSAFFNKHEVFYDYEKLIIRMLRYAWCRIVHPLPFERRYYLPAMATLSMAYTQTGRRRVWVRFGKYSRPVGKKGPWVYEDSYKGPAVTKERSYWMDTEGYVLGVTDDKTTDSTIIAAMKKNDRVNNIAAFYEFICPEGETHEFVDGACKKCSYTLGNKDPEGFAKKYSTKYDADQLLLNPPPSPRKPPVTVKVPDVQVKPLDFGLLAEAAKFCNVPPNVLASIGSFDGVVYKNIADGSYHAPVVTSKLSLRPDKIRTACISLIARYGSFVNISNDHRPSKELLDVIGDIRVPKGIMPLSEFADGFMKDYEAVFMTKSPKELVDFALGRFVSMILKLRDIANAHKEVSGIVKWIIEGTIGDERLSTKPVITSWSSIIKTQAEEVDSNTDDNLGPFTENENEDDEAGDGMDVDMEEDSDSNQIKLRDE